MSNDNHSPKPTHNHGENDMETTTHHQYYVYGSREEEWISGSYQEPWIWKSPDVLPISPNFHGFWEELPGEERISPEGLARFIEHAIPITQEEYERLIGIKKARQQADDDMEYRWYGPR